MNTLRLASRTAHIEPFHVMELLTRARELEAAGRDIVHMEVGEPDFATAEPVVRAGMEALRRGKTSYTPAAGLPALREAIAAQYAERYGVTVGPAQIFVTPGGSGALLLALSLLVDPGERVLLPDPGYPCNRHLVRLLGGAPTSVAVSAERNYQLSAADIETHWRADTAAAMVASPSNPTGTVISPQALEALAAAVTGRGGGLIVDEIYHGLTYGAPAASAAGLGAFVVNSFSKYYGMTGWRLGWLLVPPGYERAAEKLAQNVYISAPTPAQHAALACFSAEAKAIFEERRLAFQARRDFLLPALRELGLVIDAEPAGAFYLYADVSRLATDSYVLAWELLERAGVACTPGRDFGSGRADAFLRFAYTTSLPRLREGVERLAQHLRTLPPR